MSLDSGFYEVSHTADWSVKMWAPDLAALLKTSAQALYSLTETEINLNEPLEVIFTLDAVDAESLLVAFLSELLYYGEVEHTGFSQVDLDIHENGLQARLVGGPIIHQNKEVKAVTYHGLTVAKTENGLEATLILDV